MKKLKDFTEEERNWFDGEFGRGLRHMSLPSSGIDFVGYYFTFSSFVMLNDKGEPQTFNGFSYSVAPPGTLMFGVVPSEDENSIGLGHVVLPGQTVPIAFSNDPGVDGMENYFGGNVSSLCVIGGPGYLDAVVFDAGEISMNGASDIAECYRQVFEEGLRTLTATPS